MTRGSAFAGEPGKSNDPVFSAVERQQANHYFGHLAILKILHKMGFRADVLGNALSFRHVVASVHRRPSSRVRRHQRSLLPPRAPDPPQRPWRIHEVRRQGVEVQQIRPADGAGVESASGRAADIEGG